MTTSGTYTYALNKSNVINRAFQYLNIYDLAATVSSDDTSFASDLLNMMIKSWEVDGIKMWKRKQGYIFPALSTYKYDLGSATGAEHCTNSYVNTTITSAVTTALVVASTTGMTAADNIGIELDNGTRFWTTIVSVDSATGLTITSPITSASSSGNTVITYTTKLNRPLEIISAVNIDITNSNLTTTLGVTSHDNYFKLPLKSTAGSPSTYYYDKVIDGAIPHTGAIYVFPTPDDVNRILAIRYSDGLQDMTETTDDLDFPQESTLAILLGLAELLCVPYGRMQELPTIQQQAAQAKNNLEYFDSDMDPIKFKPKK